MATPPTFTTGQVLTAAQMNTIGLHLIKTQTISAGVPSVSVTSVFSADYNNYKIVVTGVGSSAGGHSIKMQLNNSTASTYSMGGIYGVFGSTVLNGYGPPVTDSWTDVLPLDTIETGGTIELYSPYLARRTLFSSGGVRSGAVSPAWYQFHGQDTSTAQNTGFTFFSIAGGSTFTGGTIRVYGYRN